MENIPYSPGMSPLSDVALALEVASRVFLQILFAAGCLTVALLIVFMVAGLVTKKQRKSEVNEKNADQESGVS